MHISSVVLTMMTPIELGSMCLNMMRMLLAPATSRGVDELPLAQA